MEVGAEVAVDGEGSGTNEEGATDGDAAEAPATTGDGEDGAEGEEAATAAEGTAGDGEAEMGAAKGESLDQDTELSEEELAQTAAATKIQGLQRQRQAKERVQRIKMGEEDAFSDGRDGGAGGAARQARAEGDGDVAGDRVAADAGGGGGGEVGGGGGADIGDEEGAEEAGTDEALQQEERYRMEIEEQQRRMQEKQEQERQITAARAQQEALAAQNAELQKRLAAFLAAKAADDGTAGAEEVAGDGAGEVENRYFHALRQAADLGAELVQVQLNYDHVALDMKTRLEQKQDRVRELREGYAAARSEAVKGGAGGQRIVPGKLLKQFEEQGARKEQELERVRLKNIHLRNQLRKLEGNLRRKEELSNELHLIDFEQLKIENQTLNEKIEERNEELLKLRKKTTTTVQVLTHLKEKLQFVQGENQLLKVELAELEAALSQHRDALTRVKHERDALRSDNLALRGEAGLIGNNDLLRDFDRRKKDIASMQVTLEDLKNRHLSVREDITELNARTMGVLTLGASR